MINEMPEPPLDRHIREGDDGPYCSNCHSSLKIERRFLIFRINTNKCINMMCINWWGRINPIEPWPDPPTLEN